MRARPARRVVLGAFLLALASGTSAGGPKVSSQSLSDSQVQQVIANLASGAKQSWELGTRAQALTEYSSESFSVLNTTSLPPSQTAPDSLNTVLGIAHDIVAGRAASNKNAVGPQPLIGNSAAGDPASIGVSVLLANWTGQQGENYAGAAADQLSFLYQKVPRAPDGAISHRTNQVQLWSDFVYMAPPFMAYYGVTTSNQTLLNDAYTQIKLYRDNLFDSPSAGGLWQHIVLGGAVNDTANDPGHWSTGNGWAAAGMLRVYGTIKESVYASSMGSQMSDLSSWVQEIHNGMYSHVDSSGLFHNYADNTSSFLDASSTALLASTVYRLALLANVHTHVPAAESARKTLSTLYANGSYAHFDSNGWLTPVVNPEAYPMEGSKSPEGQAFVVLMQAAYADWIAAGSPGQKGAAGALRAPVWAMGVGAVVALVMCVL